MDLDLIQSSIDKSLKSMSIIVDSIGFETEGKYKFLRIVLDKVGGLDLDTIVEATHIINPLVDKLDESDETYILDIVSKEIGSDKNG